MGLDKAINHGKERRKQYTGAKAIDRSCRNHGDCEWCKGNRLWQRNKLSERSRQLIADYKENYASGNSER